MSRSLAQKERSLQNLNAAEGRCWRERIPFVKQGFFLKGNTAIARSLEQAIAVCWTTRCWWNQRGTSGGLRGW